MCKHNTAGTHCQHCAPLYNDRPWEAADGKTGSPHECRSEYQADKTKSLLCKVNLSVDCLLSLETQYKAVGERHCDLHKHSSYHCSLWPQPLEAITACKVANMTILPTMCCPFSWIFCRTNAPFLRSWQNKNMARHKRPWELWRTITLVAEIPNYNHENGYLKFSSQNSPIQQPGGLIPRERSGNWGSVRLSNLSKIVNDSQDLIQALQSPN